MLGRKLGIPNLQRSHCLAHKLNLAIRNTAFAKNPAGKHKFENLVLEEKDLNSLSTFHSRSSKNMAHLRETMRAEGMTPARPHPIHKIRWSGSHKDVIEAEYRHAPVWSKHMTEIMADTSFSETQRFKATFLNNFMSDKYARITSAIMLDTQDVIGRASKEFQYAGEKVYFVKYFRF